MVREFLRKAYNKNTSILKSSGRRNNLAPYINRNSKKCYSHPKREISKNFLYFFDEIEISTIFYFFAKKKFSPILQKRSNFFIFS